MNLNGILREVFILNEEAITEDLQLIDIDEWDSMAHMFLINKIEEVYKIELSTEEIADMVSLEKIKAVLRNHQVSDEHI